VILHDVFSINEAHNKAMKIERLQSRVVPLKSTVEKISGGTKTQQDFTSGERSLARKAPHASPASPATAAAPIAKGKENPYAKSDVGKCYRCGEHGHKSNECSKKRQVNMTDYEGKDRVEIVTESEDTDFVEEYGESATCVVQRLLYN